MHEQLITFIFYLVNVNINDVFKRAKQDRFTHCQIALMHPLPHNLIFVHLQPIANIIVQFLLSINTLIHKYINNDLNRCKYINN